MSQPRATWRVQFISRHLIEEPEHDMGRHDFADEQAAREYLTSDEVTSRVDKYWRVELRYLPPWQVIESVPYHTATEEKADG